MSDIVEYGKYVLTKEAEAVFGVSDQLDSTFADVLNLVHSRSGKIVCIGVGKSAIIARKFAATLSSLGLPASFIHGADGPHGDLGIVAIGDIVFLLSYTGGSYELLANLNPLSNLGAHTIAITGNRTSPLADQCEKTLLCAVECEADALNLAPSSSSTAMLALCDAIAICASKALKFTSMDFALRHPGGTLGRRLTLRVRDLPLQKPVMIQPEDEAVTVLMSITASMVGAVLVSQQSGLPGLIMDGDVRRAIQKHGSSFFELTALDMMTVNPVAISGDELVANALEIMEQRVSQISVLLVEENDAVVAIARIHDLIGAGHQLGLRR